MLKKLLKKKNKYGTVKAKEAKHAPCKRKPRADAAQMEETI